MKLNADALSQHLSKTHLPIYLVHGDAPLLVAEALENIGLSLKKAGFVESDKLTVDAQFNLSHLRDLTQNFSLFAEKKRVELRCGEKIPPELLVWIEAYAKQVHDYPDLTLVISCGKLTPQQQKAKWVNALEAVGAVVTVWDIDLAQYPRWLEQRLVQNHLKLTPAARQSIIEQTEGNLLAGMQLIQKLAVVANPGQTLDVPDVEPLLAESATYDLFDLSRHVLLGDSKRALRILHFLEHEAEPILVLWVLAREIKLLVQIYEEKNHKPMQEIYRRLNVWEKRQTEVEAALRRIAPAKLYAALNQAAEIDLMIKGLSDGEPWFALKRLVCSLC